MPRKLTAQQVFNRAVKRLRDGTGPAETPDGFCMYLTPDNRKCVVGIFIPNGHEAQKHRGDVWSLLYDYPELQAISEHTDLLDQLQQLHDGDGAWLRNKLTKAAEDELVRIANAHDPKLKLPKAA